jgi:hypothetical protein
VQITSAANTTIKAPTTLVDSPVFGVTTIPVPMVIP